MNLDIQDYPIAWPGTAKRSTHELVISPAFIYVSGQNMDQVAKFDHQANLVAFFAMPAGSGPHGLLLDNAGRLWVSLEFSGQVVRLDEGGGIVQSIDVRLHAAGASKPINTAPHGICLDADGESIWFTGKRTSTIGKIHPDRRVEHFELNTLAALPIFLCASPDGGIWGTELLGSCILNVSPAGELREFNIPTANSRPIAVIPDPSGTSMWFTEESGMKVGRIEMDGTITEYAVPALQKNDILASLTFDRGNNLWVQVYVDHNNPTPAGDDYLIRFDASIRDQSGPSVSGVPFSIHYIPSRKSMMHRIKMDDAGNLWFTEMMTDRLGKATLTDPR